MIVPTAINFLNAKLVECCEGINVVNEGKQGSEDCCVDKPEDMEVGSCPTRCCKDASHGNTECFEKETMKRNLIYFVCK